MEDLDKAILELEDRNIPYERAVQGAGTVQIWINDPAGNTIELQQDRSDADGRSQPPSSARSRPAVICWVGSLVSR